MNLNAKLVGLAVWAVACAGGCKGGPDVVEGRYEPFDAATAGLAAPYATAHGDINAIRSDAAFSATSFADIDAVWTADLEPAVSTAVAGHAFVAEGDGLGAVLAAAIEDAIALGAADDNVGARGQVIDKTLQRFFVESMAAGLYAGDEAGWDEAYSWYGRSLDGTTNSLVSTTASKRDENFGTDYNDRIWNAFIAGRNAFVTGDTSAVDAAREEIDLLVMEVYALSAQRELREMEDAEVVADPLEHEEKLLEGAIFWSVIRDHAALVDPSGATVVDGALAAAIADDPASIDGVAVADAILAIYGLSF